MPPNPPSNAHGFAIRSMSLRDMQIPKSEKKILAPPLPNPRDAPDGGPPQVSFFSYYIGGPLRSVSSFTIRGPLSSVSSHNIWGPPSD